MAEEDIVQKIVIEVDDSQLGKLGQDAQASFEQLQRAAQQAGLSVEQFGTLSAKTQQQYINLSNGLKTTGGAFNEFGDAAKGSALAMTGAAAGLEDVAQKTIITRQEMRALSGILREVGAGQLGQLGSVFLRVSTALGELGTAALGVAAAGGALAKFAFSAADVAEQLGRISDITGEPIEKLSALQQVFAQSGVSADQFAKTFTHIAEEVADAGQHMAADIEASSQRVAQALHNEAAAALGVEQAHFNLVLATIALQKAEGALHDQRVIVDPDYQKQLDREHALLAVKQAQLALEEARQRQAQAAHARAVAEANDLEKIIELYRRLAAGEQIAFDALTTAATKHTALLKVLADAGKNWEFVLADILKNATELERREIAKALNLPADMLDRLKRGGDELRRMADEAARLGLALSDAEKHDLSNLTEAWNRLTGILGAMTEKLGALASPALIRVLNALADAFDVLIKVGTQLWQNVLGPITDAFAQVIDWGVKLVNLITGPLANALFYAVAGWKAALTGLWDIIKEVADGIYKGFVDAFNAMLAPVQAVIDTISGWIQALIDKARALWGALTGAKGAAQGGPAEDLGGLPAAGGGLISGPGTSTSDSILARLSTGEFVMRAAAVSHFGASMFHALNNLMVPRFAVGGLNTAVPRLSSPSPALAMSGQRVLNLSIEGRSFSGLSIPEQTAQSLERFAVHSQIASTGRKQSWRR